MQKDMLCVVFGSCSKVSDVGAHNKQKPQKLGKHKGSIDRGLGSWDWHTGYR